MKSPIATLVAAGAGVVLGIAVVVGLGIRDAVCTHLSLFDPGYVATQRNIATAYKQLGNGLMLVDADKARDAFTESMVIDQSITMSVPNDAAAESGVAYAYGRLGSLSMSLDDYGEAARSFERGLKVLDFLKQDTKPGDKLPLWISSDEAPLTRDEKAAGVTSMNIGRVSKNKTSQFAGTRNGRSRIWTSPSDSRKSECHDSC